MAFILVQARPGLAVPMERDPRRSIGSEPVRVEESPYYRRRLAEGDLLLVDVAPRADAPKY